MTLLHGTPERKDVPAKDVLADYLGHLRSSETYQEALANPGDAMAECRRVMDLAGRHDGDTIAFRDELILPAGDDLAYGHGTWVDKDGPNRRMVWKFGFIESWSHNRWEGFMVNHVLDPKGNGTVWMGVTNNSANEHFKGDEAWAMWAARWEPA